MQYQFDGERERRAEFAMPKRTKQMGGIEQRLRIFVEDYVYTYLYQYGRSGGGAEKLAALVGKYYELEGQRVLLISGAIQAKGTVQEGGRLFRKGSGQPECPRTVKRWRQETGGRRTGPH